jgi:uncharacterized protein
VLFNVAQLLRESTGAERTYAIDADVPSVAEDSTPAHAAGTVRFVRTHRGLLAYVRLDAILRDTCSRCLGPAETPVRVGVEEEFLPTVDVNTGAPLPPPEDEDAGAFLIDEHHHLDLTEAVRQALVTEQPMQPLCQDECAGLCPQCGADLNQGRCACPTEEIDVRWAALIGLPAAGQVPAVSGQPSSPTPSQRRDGRPPAGSPC